MAEQEACAELVRSAVAETEDTTESGERGESLLLPLLQGLLDGERSGGGDKLLAGLGAHDADVVADVRRALRRLRAVLTDPATERQPKREALLALVDRLEDGLDASADRLDGCKRQSRASRRRSKNLRHTVGVTREELEVARRLVDETDLDELMAKPESEKSKTFLPPDTHEKEEKSKKQKLLMTHSVSYDGASKLEKIENDVMRRQEYVNKDKNMRHSIANGFTESKDHSPNQSHQPLHKVIPEKDSQMQRTPSQNISRQSNELVCDQNNEVNYSGPQHKQQHYGQIPYQQKDGQQLNEHQYGEQPTKHQYGQQQYGNQQEQHLRQQLSHQQEFGQSQEQQFYENQSQHQPLWQQQTQQAPFVQLKNQQPPLLHQENIQQTPLVQQHIQQQRSTQSQNQQPQFARQQQKQYQPPHQYSSPSPLRRPSKENIQLHAPMITKRNETNGLPIPSSQAVSTAIVSKDNIFHRAPLYRPPPPGYNFASAPQPEESMKPLSRFNSTKRNRMKRANTIDIPKPLNFYRVESDTEDETTRGRNSAEAPTVPTFQPKTENDRKFLAFIQKNKEDNGAPFSPAKAAAAQPQNWNSRFGIIKNAFEDQSQSQDRSRSSSSSSARNFWKAADDQSVNPVKHQNYGPRLSRRSIQDLQQMHASKAAAAQSVQSRPRWSTETNGDVVSGSLTVTGPNHANSIVQAPAKPFIAKPIPVNQFSHAPMSAFKPLKKVASPVASVPHVWSPPSYERNLSSERNMPSERNISSERNNSIGRNPSIERDLINERDRIPSQTLSINDTYVPSKPAPKSPTSAPWLVSNTDRPKKVVSLTASKFENPQLNSKYNPTYTSPSIQPKIFAPFETQKPTVQSYQNLNLAAPELVKKFDNMKTSELHPAPAIDARKLQIEFYEKRILENNKSNALNGHTHPVKRATIPPSAPQVYTVTNYTPAQVTTFVPLQQTPDIEKARAHKVDYLPDVVLNEHNQYASIVKSPGIQKSSSMSKITPRGNLNGPNYTITRPGIIPNGDSPGYLEPQYDSSLTVSEYDPTEYTTVTRVMRGPAPQQATIKSGVTSRNDEGLRGMTAAKNLKGVLQKFSSPKHEVLSQIERKKQEQRAAAGYQVPSPQPQRMDRQMYSKPVNTNRNYVPPTPPDPKPSMKPVPVIKYNNIRSPPKPRELVQSTESLDSKHPSPAVAAKLKAFSPHSYSSTTPSPTALSKSESWHQLMRQQASSTESVSPRASPRRVVARAKSMHLLSVPKLFEGGIAQEQLLEKRKTVEAYFSGQGTPNSLSKSNSQQTIPESDPPSPAPRKSSVSRTKTSEKRSFSLGRSRTMPTINDLKFLDESNADDAFENLLKETFS